MGWILVEDVDIDRRSGVVDYNHTTNELLDFMHNYYIFVKAIDPDSMVSNGFSMPRPAAEHLRRQPEWLPEGPDWTSDSKEEFKKSLLDAGKDADIISVHFYNFCSAPGCTRDNERFGLKGMDNVDLLNEVTDIVSKAGKILFIGETDGGDSVDGNLLTPFYGATLEKIGRLKIPFSALWEWEGYYSSTRTRLSNIEPGFSDLLIAKIREVNEKYFNRLAPEPRFPDSIRPALLITSPLDNTQIGLSGLDVYAVASDNDRVEKVEFWLENLFLGEIDKPPYRLKLPAIICGSELELRLKVKAFDPSGNFAESAISISGISVW